jgi:hypothetical protein
MAARLLEPDGTKNLIVSEDFAIEFCMNHPGWTWEKTENKSSSMGETCGPNVDRAPSS